MQQKSEPLQKGTFFAGFHEHPASVGETYVQHLGFACYFSSRLLVAGLAALIHAFIPPLFESTASRIICELHERISSRHRE